MYINGKMVSVETIPGKEGGVIKKNGEGSGLKYDIFDIL
jgi:hypothetical protein